MCIQAALPIDEDVVVGEKECKAKYYCDSCLYDELELVVKNVSMQGAPTQAMGSNLPRLQ